MPDTAIIQTVIQGGAVGLMVLGIAAAYKLLKLGIEKGYDLVGNHLNTLTGEVQATRVDMQQVRWSAERVANAVEKLADRDAR